MAINRIEIKDFLVFKGEFATDFCPGVNVIIGGNATGKTTLLKAMYRLCGNGKNRETEEYFLAVGRTEGVFYRTPFEYARIRMKNENEEMSICVRYFFCDGPTHDNNIYVNGMFTSIDPNKYEDDYTRTRAINYSRDSTELVFTSDNYVTLPSVFLPSTNLLPQSRALPEMIGDYEMDFDAIQIDNIKNARRPITRLLKPNCSKVIERLSNIIDGEVLYENDRFYIKKRSGLKLEFSMEASGFVRLGLLWKLLRNGLLESGTILFWDEPENSLNPEQVPILVDILLELSRNGVQIFLATHSEILASYFAVDRKKGDVVVFYALYREGESIMVESSDRFDLLDNNKLSAEPVKLYKKQLER